MNLNDECGERCDDVECLCVNCVMTIPEFVLMNEDESKRMCFMQKYQLIHSFRDCPECGSTLKCRTGSNFRCQKSRIVNRKLKKCTFKESIYKNTFFENSHLGSKTILYFVMHWLGRNPPRHDFIKEELKLSDKIIVDWSSFCREVLLDRVMKKSEPIGGPGITVEIDESKFGKRKNNKGRVIEGTWVFGGIERDNPGRSFFVPVKDRSTATLLDVIKKKILPGTTVMSDCWKSYDCLKDEGFNHLKVNHSLNFVDPVTLAHTQNIERKWRDIKAKIVKDGRKAEHFEGYLAEYLFKYEYPVVKTRYHPFFKAAASLYPGWVSK